ncbi:hypothetical protein PPBDW_I21499 [Photobacterium kishitanii]|nr:hypothetical protein PPBDW_I21499 [Photobacterium kishitanii]
MSEIIDKYFGILKSYKNGKTSCIRKNEKITNSSTIKKGLLRL